MNETIAPKKPVVVIRHYSSCNGCLNNGLATLGMTLVAIAEAVDIAECRLISWATYEDGPIDILIIEGSINTDEEAEDVTRLCERLGEHGLLILVGACAVNGGFAADLSDEELEKMKQGVYGVLAKEQGPRRATPILGVVKRPALLIPGCPVNSEELVYAICVALHGGAPIIRNRPLCMDCVFDENACLLMKGVLCLGPITSAGCGAFLKPEYERFDDPRGHPRAYCPANTLPCTGCRGFLPNANFEAFLATAESYGIPREEVLHRMRLWNAHAVNEIEKKLEGGEK